MIRWDFAMLCKAEVLCLSQESGIFALPNWKMVIWCWADPWHQMSTWPRPSEVNFSQKFHLIQAVNVQDSNQEVVYWQEQYRSPSLNQIQNILKDIQRIFEPITSQHLLPKIVFHLNCHILPYLHFLLFYYPYASMALKQQGKTWQLKIGGKKAKHLFFSMAFIQPFNVKLFG